MAKNGLPPGVNQTSRFLIGMTSKLMPETPGVPYYTNMKQTRAQGSLQDKFLQSFDSQVYPTVLPEAVQPTIPGNLILSEFDNPLLTEIGDYLILEP